MMQQVLNTETDSHKHIQPGSTEDLSSQYSFKVSTKD